MSLQPLYLRLTCIDLKFAALIEEKKPLAETWISSYQEKMAPTKKICSWISLDNWKMLDS